MNARPQGRPTSPQWDAERLRRVLPIQASMGHVGSHEVAACAGMTERAALMLLDRCAERGWAARDGADRCRILWRVYPPPRLHPDEEPCTGALDAVHRVVTAGGEMTTADVWEMTQHLRECTHETVHAQLLTLEEFGEVVRLGRRGRHLLWRSA